MIEHYILTEQGEPHPEPDVIAWAEWMAKMAQQRPGEDATGRHIAVSVRGEPGQEVRVSTIFLGLDHSFVGPPPVLFETLVFGGALDSEMDRYVTRDEAVAGHAAMVRRVEAALPDGGRRGVKSK